MSVSQESLDMTKSVQSVEEAPELEYSTVRSDSLAMFGAAIGGAVLGMLLTLLILAIINGGTLNFTGGSNVADLEAHLARVNENVGSVSANVDIVAEQARVIQEELASVEAALSTQLAGQTDDIETINEAMVGLAASRARVDFFLTALSEAMSGINDLGSEGGAASE